MRRRGRVGKDKVGELAPGLWRVEELALHSPAAALRRADLAPHLGSTIELNLLMEVNMARDCKHGDLACPSSAIWRNCSLPYPRPSPPVAGGRAGPEVVRAGELVLPLTNRSTQDSDLCNTVELTLVV
ncbi:hypothetical protein NN561_000303 [Cricetulus griseus]